MIRSKVGISFSSILLLLEHKIRIERVPCHHFLADHIAGFHAPALAQTRGVPLEMCVVIAETAGWIELIDRLGEAKPTEKNDERQTEKHDAEPFQSSPDRLHGALAFPLDEERGDPRCQDSLLGSFRGVAAASGTAVLYVGKLAQLNRGRVGRTFCSRCSGPGANVDATLVDGLLREPDRPVTFSGLEYSRHFLDMSGVFLQYGQDLAVAGDLKALRRETLIGSLECRQRPAVQTAA